MTDLTAFKKNILNNRGFSMVELIVVIAISAAMMAYGIPKINKWVEHAELKGVARRVVNDLHLCRQKAISENKFYKIDFNTSIPITYTIQFAQALAGPYTNESTVTIPESAGYASFISTADPVFTNRGTAVASISVTITKIYGVSGMAKKIDLNVGGQIKLTSL